MTQLLESMLAADMGDLAPLRLGPGRLVVVVPHPDDEALATGGLIAHHAAAGDRVIVVAVTDGEAAFGDWDADDLATTRRREQDRSLAELGVVPADVVRLCLPDGAVEWHVGHLADALAELVDHHDVLVAPSPWDWHPDHGACGRAARSAAALVGVPTLWSTFWAHHHPDRLIHHAGPLVRFTLSPGDLERRRRAVACHRSQLGMPGRSPVVRPEQLAHLAEPVEYYHR